MTNLVRLLDLESEIQELIRIAVLQIGHGKVLLSLTAGALRVKLAGRAAREGVGWWSRRESNRPPAARLMSTPRTISSISAYRELEPSSKAVRSASSISKFRCLDPGSGTVV